MIPLAPASIVCRIANTNGDFHASHVSGQHVGAAGIDLLSRGVILAEPLISAKAPLEEGADWFDRLYAAEAGLMKVILQPSTNS